MRIFTIGYEGATQAELVAALRAAGVERVIDVRAVPLSRKPGFSKNVLAAGLAEAGIGYVHLKALGTPPEGRGGARPGRRQVRGGRRGGCGRRKALGAPPEGREAARKGRHEVLERVYAEQLETPEAAVQAA